MTCVSFHCTDKSLFTSIFSRIRNKTLSSQLIKVNFEYKNFRKEKDAISQNQREARSDQYSTGQNIE